jgi:hypothetical protein
MLVILLYIYIYIYIYIYLKKLYYASKAFSLFFNLKNNKIKEIENVYEAIVFILVGIFTNQKKNKNCIKLKNKKKVGWLQVGAVSFLNK